MPQVSVVMILVAWSSKKYKERHLHGGIPVFISGVAFLYALNLPAVYAMLCYANWLATAQHICCMCC